MQGLWGSLVSLIGKLRPIVNPIVNPCLRRTAEVTNRRAGYHPNVT